MQKVQAALLAVIAAGILALLMRSPEPVAVTVEPCIVVVNPTQRVSADGLPVIVPAPIGRQSGC